MLLWNLVRDPRGRGIWLGLGCGLLVWLFVTRSSLWRGPEDWMLDGCFFYRQTRPTRAPVVLIGLDDASLRELKKPLAFLSPELARVVRHVHKQGAAAIGIDVLVPDSLDDDRDIEEPDGRGEARSMGTAVLQAGEVVLPCYRTGHTWQQPLQAWRLKTLKNPELTDVAFVNLTEDDDQFVRRQALLLRDGRRAVPQFALAVYARAVGEPVVWDDEHGELRVGGRAIPLDPGQELRINYVGPPGSFRELSFRDVLAAEEAGAPLPELSGAIVLIGAAAHGLQDLHATPFANRYASYLGRATPGLMPGTEIQAHVVATLYDRAYITTPAWLQPLPCLLLMGAVLGFTFARLPLSAGFLAAVVHHFAWKLLALAAFALANWRVEMVAMMVLGVVTYGATFAWRWRLLRRMLGVVKSEAVARILESDPRRLDPGGEEREVTVLFADVRDFTTFSERHSARDVVSLLNAYFGAIVPLIEGEGGVINVYMGDGIMVLFGGLVRQDDHALRAVRAARAMVRRVHELHSRWAELGAPDFRIGVGVHSGTVVIGAIGSPRRLDYTAVGDTVNAAARIEARNKEERTEILVSSSTYQMLPEGSAERLACGRLATMVTVKGKAIPLELFALPVP